jgi:hypothetical protein
MHALMLMHLIDISVGCGTLWAIDGNWKLSYPICMYEEAKYAFAGKLKYTSSCPHQPMHGMAFCTDHCATAKNLGIPIELRAYLKYKKTSSKEDCKDDGSEKSCSKSIIKSNSTTVLSAADCQGICCA